MDDRSFFEDLLSEAGHCLEPSSAATESSPVVGPATANDCSGCRHAQQVGYGSDYRGSGPTMEGSDPTMERDYGGSDLTMERDYGGE